jgi:hypothetical protein
VVDEAMAHDRAWRLFVGPHAGCQEELSVEVSALMETQQLERRVPDAEDPSRYEARVLGKEAVFAPLVSADVADAVSDDEGVPVEDAKGPLKH